MFPPAFAPGNFGTFTDFNFSRPKFSVNRNGTPPHGAGPSFACFNVEKGLALSVRIYGYEDQLPFPNQETAR